MSVEIGTILIDFTSKAYDIKLVPIILELELVAFIIKCTDLVINPHDFNIGANDFTTNLYSLAIKPNSFALLLIREDSKSTVIIIKSTDLVVNPYDFNIGTNDFATN